MHGIFAYIWLLFMVHVDIYIYIYIPYTDPLGKFMVFVSSHRKKLPGVSCLQDFCGESSTSNSSPYDSLQEQGRSENPGFRGRWFKNYC